MGLPFIGQCNNEKSVAEFCATSSLRFYIYFLTRGSISISTLLGSADIGDQRSKIVECSANIWMSCLAGPDLLFVLACRYSGATFESSFERSETVKSHLMGDAGN